MTCRYDKGHPMTTGNHGSALIMVHCVYLSNTVMGGRKELDYSNFRRRDDRQQPARNTHPQASVVAAPHVPHQTPMAMPIPTQQYILVASPSPVLQQCPCSSCQRVVPVSQLVCTSCARRRPDKKDRDHSKDKSRDRRRRRSRSRTPSYASRRHRELPDESHRNGKPHEAAIPVTAAIRRPFLRAHPRDAGPPIAFVAAATLPNNDPSCDDLVEI